MPSRRANSKTFLDIYNLTIAPKLEEIDIFLKERESPITIWQISQLLDMPYVGVSELVHTLEIENINHESFFLLLTAGTSPICGFIRREAERGFPQYYTPADISFIYEINVKKIEHVFEALGIEKVKSQWLHFIFALIPAD